MDKDFFVQKVKLLCLERGVKPTNACKECGVGGSFLSDINRGQIPSVAKVQQLANYLGVTVSELLGEVPVGKSQYRQEIQTEAKKKAPPVSGEAMEVAEAYDAADPYLQLSVRKLLDLDAQRNEIRIAARRSDGPRTSTGPDTDVEI